MLTCALKVLTLRGDQLPGRIWDRLTLKGLAEQQSGRNLGWDMVWQTGLCCGSSNCLWTFISCSYGLWGLRLTAILQNIPPPPGPLPGKATVAYWGHQVATFHDVSDQFTSFRFWRQLIMQEVTSREMCKSIFFHQLSTLCAFARAWAT